jgi:collagenase-like PrtC family protease
LVERPRGEKSAPVLLSVPTDWTDALLDGIRKLPVVELYGSLPATVTGGGRSAKILPDVTRDTARAHISRARDQGLEFNYLVNGACLGNREVLPEFKRALYDHLSWVAEAGVETVTVANIFVLDFVRTHFPALKVKTSIFMLATNLPTLRRLRASGADAVTLAQGDNRRFGLLKKLRRYIDGEIWLIANLACAYDCPALAYHANASAHDSQEPARDDAGANTYPILTCTLEKLRDARQLIRARWIRPEDLSVYEEMGFDRFKLAGRDAGTDWILNTAAAYAGRAWDGNLAEILDGFHYLRGWQRRAGNIPFQMPYIDNRRLDGFIDHFAANRCTDACDECGHCDRAARAAVALHREENQAFIDVIDAYAQSKRAF